MKAMRSIRLIYVLLSLFVICGCKDPFVNARISAIYQLNTECLNDSAWSDLKRYHMVDTISKPELMDVLKKFRKQPFTTQIYYFNNPEELIGVDHDLVRYVFNKKIKEYEILNGLSKELSKTDKERIGSRIQDFLRAYQCKGQRDRRYVQHWDNDKK
jgi:hypothetical protein